MFSAKYSPLSQKIILFSFAVLLSSSSTLFISYVIPANQGYQSQQDATQSICLWGVSEGK